MEKKIKPGHKLFKTWITSEFHVLYELCKQGRYRDPEKLKADLEDIASNVESNLKTISS